jgi:dihydroxy-acid dehydratase
LAIVADGDPINIDLDNNQLNLDRSDDEITRRLSNWHPPSAKYRRGVLAKYARLVSSASEGAVTS